MSQKEEKRQITVQYCGVRFPKFYKRGVGKAYYYPIMEINMLMISSSSFLILFLSIFVDVVLVVDFGLKATWSMSYKADWKSSIFICLLYYRLDVFTILQLLIPMDTIYLIVKATAFIYIQIYMSSWKLCWSKNILTVGPRTQLSSFCFRCLRI